MKKILYVLMAASVLFACNKTQEQEVTPSDDPSTPAGVVFEVDDIEPLSAQAQTLKVNVRTNVEFDVVVPEDVTWITYVATKSAEPAAEAKAKTIEFAVSLNEEDQMRQASIALKDKDGKTLKTLAIMQKSGGGIEIEVEVPQEGFPVEGGKFELKVTSNVPFSAVSEAEWIKVTAKEAAVELEIDPNEGVEPREGVVDFFREGTDKLIYTITVKQNEPYIILGDAGFVDLASALEAYKALTEGPVVLKLGAGTHKGDIIIGEDNVELEIDGQGKAVLDGFIQVIRKAVTVKNLTIAPGAEVVAPEQSVEGFANPCAIYINTSGYGVAIDNVAIDMSQMPGNATGVFIHSENGASYINDRIKRVTIDGGSSGHRLIQAYGAHVDIVGNLFKGPYESYAVRIGGEGARATIASNRFEGKSAAAVNFHNLTKSVINIGDGESDTNTMTSDYDARYTANTNPTEAGAQNTFNPSVSYSNSVLTFSVPTPLPISLNRIWGYYGSTDKELWYDKVSLRSNWNRNAVILDDYVYATVAGIENGEYGVAAFKLSDGSYVRTITNGISTSGTFATCGMTRLDDGTVLVSNMEMSGGDLIVYELDGVDENGCFTRAKEVLRYKVPEGERYGDKMTSYGDINEGYLFFVSAAMTTAQRTNIFFRIEDGVINETPEQCPYLQVHTGTVFGGIYMFKQYNNQQKTREAFYGSSFDFRGIALWQWDKLDGWYQFEVDKVDGDKVYSNYTSLGKYDENAQEPRLFNYGGTWYIAYATVTMDNAYAGGFLRLVKLPGGPDGSGDYATNKAVYSVRNDPDCFAKYPLADPVDVTAVSYETTNKTAFCDVVQTDDGEVYILAGITSAGISLFKVE